MNLVVTDSLAADSCLPDIQKKCRDIVSYFNRSCKASERLNSIQTRLNLANHKLIQIYNALLKSWKQVFSSDKVGTLHMFERIVEQNEAITTTLCLLNRNELCLSEAEIATIKEAIVLLQPFEAATREMSSVKYISLSKVIPIARSLQQVTVAANSSTSLGPKLVSEMGARFHYMESNSTLASACLLDPQ